MKNKLLITIALLSIDLGLHENAIAQQNPTSTSPGALFNGTSSNQFWSRAGNNATLGINNIFGTVTGFNSPIYTQTNGAFREKLNGDFNIVTQYQINGYTFMQGVNTSGYLLLGENNVTQGSGGALLYQTKGAFSMLHLNGYQSSIPGAGFTQEYGYRPWMKIGITYTGNNDLMYMGVRSLQAGSDQSEMVAAWSDNSSPGVGPDDFAFRFIGVGAGTTISTDLNSEDDLDGRHIARFAPTGEMGLGNTFGSDNPLYVRPQALLHMSRSLNSEVYMQITNQNGTGQTATDGLRVGYAITATNNLEARINQQENDRLSLYSNNGERIRITQIGALNGGVAFNPGGLAANRTRVAISHDPNTPITRPLSLLHLGYDVQGVTNDGWRPWMDVGMFVSNQSDNVYIGLKQEAGTATGFDRQDAVLGWGDNQTSGLPPGNGPDNLRFIFTSTTAPTAGGTPPATGANGLEGGRMTPTLTTGVFTGLGGDPTANPYLTGINPTATLEVNSWGATTAAGGSSGLRFTNLNTTSPTTANPGTGVLSVNATGDVIYVEGNTNNAPGNYCTATTPSPLTDNFGIPLNNFNYYFTDPAGTLNDGVNFVKIGDNCTAPISAKLQVHRGLTTNAQVQVSGSYTLNDDVAQSTPGSGYGFGASGNATGNNRENGGVYGTANGAATNSGGYFEAVSGYVSSAVNAANVGTHAFAANAQNNTGVLAMASGSAVINTGGSFTAINATTINVAVSGISGGGTANTNAGGRFFVNSGAHTNYGIYAHVPGTGSLEYAGYFDGDVYVNSSGISGSGYLVASDQNIKTNISPIVNAMAIIDQLQPKSFYFDTLNTHNLRLSSKKQYGVIAQQVAMVLPELVSTTTKPADLDSAGNVINAAYTYKAVNYNAFIGILLKGMQEQQSKIDSLDNNHHQQDSITTSLQNQINVLSDMINACCASHQALNSTGSAQPVNVALRDGQNIVLNQNTPNPWAEQTVISYFLPDNVNKAQILFYNAQGKLIQATELTQKGAGQLNVFGDDLSNGIYTYTLVVDGKVVESKKMVKQ